MLPTQQTKFSPPKLVAALFCAAHLLWVGAPALAADDLSQPLHVNQNGHFLAKTDGTPFFWLADNAGLLAQRLNHEETDLYLSDRARKAFSVIQLGAATKIDWPNYAGELPFIDNDPARPNSRYFDNVDWVIERAAHHGLRVAIYATWGTYVTGGYEGGPKIFNENNATFYGRWLATRLRNRGVTWILGGDTNPRWPKHLAFRADGTVEKNLAIVDYAPVYDALARGLKDGAQGRALITYHPPSASFPGTAHPRTSLYFADRAWLDFNMLQSGHFAHSEIETFPELGADFGWLAAFNYEPVADEYRSEPTRPVIDGESRWEDLGIDIKKGPPYWGAPDIRRSAYQAVFAGAAGHTYGNENVVWFYDPARHPAAELEWRPWREALHAPGAGQMQHLKALMLSRPYFSRVPDQAIVVGNSGRGEEHIAATRDVNGTYLMVYAPQGQPLKVNLSKLAGTRAVGWWFDPRTGAATRIGGRIATSRTRSFMPPTRGQNADWVLVLDDEKENFPSPGSQQ